MKKFFLIALGLLCMTGLFAQDNTLLWKVSGNGLTKDSYVFGTLHMACADDFRIADKVKNALGVTDKIAFEVDVTKPENMQLVQGALAPNPEFFNGLAVDKKQFIDSVLTSLQVPPMIFDQVSPVAVISMLAMKSFDCPDMNSIKMMEMELQALEDAKGKTVEELETITFQMDLMSELFSAEDLYTYLKESGNMSELTKCMVKAYFEENIAELEEMMINTAYLSPEKQALLLDTRNEAWLEKMPAMMEADAYFFAVGAGHLVGEKGIVQLLKDKGYTLTPILN